MSKVRWLSILMGITILAITGFQFYWLRQNYTWEQAAMEMRTDMLFRQTIMKLQVLSLNLDTAMWSERFEAKPGREGKVKIMIKEGGARDVDIHVGRGEGVVSTMNMIRDKL